METGKRGICVQEHSTCWYLDMKNTATKECHFDFSFNVMSNTLEVAIDYPILFMQMENCSNSRSCTTLLELTLSVQLMKFPQLP